MSQPIDVHFSSKSNDWRTPPWLFKQLDAEFGGFDLDAAADKDSALCARYYTEEMDALKQEWGKDGTTLWINPPYGKLGPLFIKKAHEETLSYPRLTVVMLVPARPDTRYWHAYCAKAEVRYMKGRIKFLGKDGAAVREPTASVLEGKHAPNNAAPFPSAIVVFGAKAKAGTTRYVVYKEPVAP